MLPAFHRIFGLHWFILAPRKKKKKKNRFQSVAPRNAVSYRIALLFGVGGRPPGGRSGNVNGIRHSELGHPPL